MLAEVVGPVPIVPLSEMADLVRGVSYPKADAREEPALGFVPVLRATNIQDAKLVLDSDLVFVAERNVSADQLLRPGDIVVATSSGSKHLVGKSGQLPAAWQGSFGAFCATIRPRPGIHSRYLALFLQAPSYWRQISQKALGVNINNLRRGDLESLEVPLPSLAVQACIVAELEKQFSRLDEAVANLKRVKANLKRYEAAVLRAAVEGQLVQTEAELRDREGESFETGSQLLARVLLERRRRWIGKGIYQEPAAPGVEGLPPLPEGWAWARLDAVAALKGGITVDKKRRDSTARSVPYLRVANVQRGYLDLDEVKEIEAPQADVEELRLQPGDILFNEGGDRDKLGRGWIWEGQLAECIHQNHVFRARPYLAEVSGKLISWWGNTFGKDYFLREGKQTTNLASINMTKLSPFPVPIPPATEQRRIVSEVDRRLSIVREVEAEVDANLKRAQALRQAALAQAFAG
ncbi:restriction endonuclease subunit S [Accumulibacter sp.]|uniref:restriction endonuclease subunit S n=1 Tax=Accumulibacter sp. TaxID=2053492 RepID=UPI0025EF69B2|nr:restriction endonuclease subunit S [Accumulibacter sp.]MCM8612056.1 restriction endonuclease subunit S [Accumulibacter sp.]MCM8635722.1 restriction endonuclease subunit S [Accumulibacter sp.]MCM8641662.1 restriction endonuclease subunit S [Accumulibacter sp.]